MERRVRAWCVVALVGLVACSGSDDVDDVPPPPITTPATSIGGINGPAVVNPSFDPFASDPSTSSVNPRD